MKKVVIILGKIFAILCCFSFAIILSMMGVSVSRYSEARTTSEYIFIIFFFSLAILVLIGGIFLIEKLFSVSISKRLFSFLPSFKKRKLCVVCGQKGKDYYIQNGKEKSGYYCRTHLLEKYKADFLVYPDKFVVFHPELQRKYCDSLFSFYPASQMVEAFNFAIEDMNLIQTTAQNLSGACQKCNQYTAQVAYFSRGALPWRDDIPFISEVVQAPQALCTQCALQYIIFDLFNHPKDFSDGLYAPYGGVGVYVSTTV